MTTFISGPMTGCEDFNYPVFHKVARKLAERGELFYSPAHHPVMGYELEPPKPDEARSWEYYMKRSLKKLLKCDNILMLPGWERSRGARIERDVAVTLKMTVDYWLGGV